MFPNGNGRSTFDQQNTNFQQKLNSTYASQPQQTIGGQTSYASPNYQAYQAGYQVKPNDTFASIAQANNLTPEAIQGANNGMLVPPPKGSYINLPANLDPAIASSNLNGYYAAHGVTPGHTVNQTMPSQLGLGGGNSSVYNQRALQSSVISITQQLSTGVFPVAIPFNVLNTMINPQTGQPLTDAEKAAMGYVANNLTGQYEQKGTGAQPGVSQPGQINGPGGTPRTVDAQGNPWDAKTATRDIYGDRFIQKGAMRWERIHGKLQHVQYLGNGKKKILGLHSGKGTWVSRAKHAAEASAQTNDTSTPSRVLSLHIGSG